MPRRASVKIYVQRKLLYVGYLLAGVLARAVPPAVAYPILDLVGGLLWRVNRSARRAVEANLGQVIRDRGPRWRGAVRDVFRHGARNSYDTFRIPRLTPSELDRLVPIRGWEHLDAALAEGRGAILVGAHLSSLAVGGQA